MGSTETVDGGWRGEITGEVTERDIWGSPKTIREIYTNNTYERNVWGTFDKVDPKPDDSNSGGSNK